jgi:hypothetical protein
MILSTQRSLPGGVGHWKAQCACLRMWATDTGDYAFVNAVEAFSGRVCVCAERSEVNSRSDAKSRSTFAGAADLVAHAEAAVDYINELRKACAMTRRRREGRCAEQSASLSWHGPCYGQASSESKPATRTLTSAMTTTKLHET